MGDIAVPDRLHLAVDVHKGLLCGHEKGAGVVGNGSAAVTAVVARAAPSLLWSDYKVALGRLVHLHRRSTVVIISTTCCSITKAPRSALTALTGWFI